MVDIRNPVELNRAMNAVVEKAIEEVSNELLDRLHYYIMRDVYNAHDPNHVYLGGTGRPSNEFRAAWRWTPTQRQGLNTLCKQLFYQWQGMGANADRWQHGSHVPGWYEDVREYLAEFLNKKGKSSGLWISVNHQPFWDNFTTDIFDQGGLERIFEQVLGKYGFKRV
jgi:hypothetical protein